MLRINRKKNDLWYGNTIVLIQIYSELVIVSHKQQTVIGGLVIASVWRV